MTPTENVGVRSGKFGPAAHCCSSQWWEVLCKLISTQVDRCNKAIRDAAITHVVNQRINGRLPFGLGHTCSYFIVGNDARITLCERDEDQNPRAIFSLPNPTAGKLLQGSAVSATGATADNGKS